MLAGRSVGPSSSVRRARERGLYSASVIMPTTSRRRTAARFKSVGSTVGYLHGSRRRRSTELAASAGTSGGCRQSARAACSRRRLTPHTELALFGYLDIRWGFASELTVRGSALSVNPRLPTWFPCSATTTPSRPRRSTDERPLRSLFRRPHPPHVPRHDGRRTGRGAPSRPGRFGGPGVGGRGRAEPDSRREPETRRPRLAIDPCSRRQGRVSLPLDRRLLLEAKRQGRRDDRHHGLDRSAAAVPDRDLPHGLLRRPGRPADDDPRPLPGQGPAGPGTRPEEPPRVPLGADHPARRFPPTGPAASTSAGSRPSPERDAEPYWQSYVVFIVRDDRPADILFQCSDNTWQAYNRWPNNYSVYTHPEGDAGALGRRQLRPALRPRGAARRRRQRPAHRSAPASSCRSSSRSPTGSNSTATT